MFKITFPTVKLIEMLDTYINWLIIGVALIVINIYIKNKITSDNIYVVILLVLIIKFFLELMNIAFIHNIEHDFITFKSIIVNFSYISTLVLFNIMYFYIRNILYYAGLKYQTNQKTLQIMKLSNVIAGMYNKELSGHLKKVYYDNNKCECSICIDNITEYDELYMTMCGHTFHQKCITDYFEFNNDNLSSCPMCRTSI